MEDEDRKRAEQAQVLKKIMDDMVLIQESFAVMAKTTRTKYLALVKEGFTEAQAIELCKN